MRVLIIDNYDSFTGNLCQLVAGVTGHAPFVVRNDAVGLDQVLALNLDAIVLSPGPGDPRRKEDFGICAEVIQHAGVPVLGVCLGFQGIAHAFGATVQRARHPLHGVQSQVRHTACDLFEGLPNPLHAVRYHSLEALVPDEGDLEVLATAMDGTVMAVRHRDRPVWGVQFHPESIGTEAGDLLIRNFMSLAAAAATEPERASAAPAAGPSESQGPLTTHVVKWKRLATWCPPEDCFADLYGDESNAFWLDSSLHLPGRSRFSFMGASSDLPESLMHYDAQQRRVVCEGRDGSVERRESTVFDVLDEIQNTRARADLPFDFVGGWVGYVGYEARAGLGHAVVCPNDMPDAEFMYVDTFVAFDHEERVVYAVSVSPSEDVSVAVARAEALAARIASVQPGSAGLFDRAPRCSIQPEYSLSREAYIERVGECQELIRDGESYEICLTMNAEWQTTENPLSLYLSLRESNPAPYSAFFRMGSHVIACSSPERFLKIDQHGWAESKPIKGTAPRGDTAERDSAIRDALFNSAKNRAENLMIVDLLRHDLSQSCEIGSVHVPKLMDIESYQTVHQMVSTIRGRLKSSASAIDCLRDAFPGGSMTGAPKIRTMQLLNTLEASARGAYSGTLGFFSLNGCADLNIVIRSAVFDGPKVRVGMGGAVTLLSDPGEEYDEAMLKGDVVLRAMQGRATTNPH